LGDNTVVTIGAGKPNCPRGKWRSMQGRADRIKLKHDVPSIPGDINLDTHSSKNLRFLSKLGSYLTENAMLLCFKHQ
jgi:hypothetical protein